MWVLNKVFFNSVIIIDEVLVIEYVGGKVVFINGNFVNIKIIYFVDFLLVEFYIK